MTISCNHTGFELKGFYSRRSDRDFKAIMHAAVWANTSKTEGSHRKEVTEDPEGSHRRSRTLPPESLRKQKKNEPITPVLNDLRWLSVPATLAHDAILTFKCLRGLAPKYLSSRCNTRASVHGSSTRNKNSQVRHHNVKHNYWSALF